jgi:hypothetical protein
VDTEISKQEYTQVLSWVQKLELGFAQAKSTPYQEKKNSVIKITKKEV